MAVRRREHCFQDSETDTLSAKLDQIGARLEVIEAGLKDLGRHH
jgi:hypothetical protein